MKHKLLLILLSLTCSFAYSQEQTNCSRQYTDQDVQNVQNRMDVAKIMAMNGRKYIDPNFSTDATKVFNDKKQYEDCLKEEKTRNSSSSFRKYHENSSIYNQNIPEGSVMSEMINSQNRMMKQYLGN